MIKFITNRTQADVDRLLELSRKGWQYMTVDEKNEWLGVDSEGNEIETSCTRAAYSAKDLNRIGEAVEEIASAISLPLTSKTNWLAGDIPKTTAVDLILYNLQRIRPFVSSTHTPPTTLAGLDWRKANIIELFLLDCYNAIGKNPLTVTHDGAGNVTVSKGGMAVSHDYNGNVILSGVTASVDENGNVTIF